MTIKRIWSSLFAIVAVVVLFTPVLLRADDSLPPCWRGGSNTTYQSWVFTISNNPALPESSSNPNGIPGATMTIGAFGKGWLATSFGGKTGLWELGQAGQVNVAISNFAGFATAPKYVQVQVTYFEATVYLAPTVSVPGATLVSAQTVNNLSAPPGLWRTQVTLWRINPSPANETVIISGSPTKGLLIDQIVVDTRIASGGDGDVPAFKPCWRGVGNSTFAHWAFGVSNNPAALSAELVTNVYGAPVASVVPGPFSSGYIAEDTFLGCRQGIWDLGRLGTMSMSVPNAPGLSGSSYKYVQVEVTQLRDGIYLQNAAVSLAGGTLVNQQQQNIETNGFGGIWVVEKSVWRVGPPSPVSEMVVLTGGTNGSLIDQVVVDTLALDFPCPGDMVVAADAGQCSKSNVTWSVPVVDGCVVTNVVSVPVNGSTFAVGTNPVTCVVYDRYGGTRTCNFSVAVIDAQPPIAVCTNITINLDLSGNASIVGADVDGGSADNCGIASRSVTPNIFTCANIGPNPVTLTVTDVHGNFATCNAIVTVQDNLPPVFACPAAITNFADLGQCSATFSLPGLLATDNCGVASISSNAPAFFQVGVTPVTWTVVDLNNNTNSCVQLVVIVDNQLPQFTCPTAITNNADLGQCTATFSLAPLAAMDNCGVASVVSNAPLNFPVGTTSVTWTVVDVNGNTNACTQLVVITDNQLPQFTCPPAITNFADLGQCSATFALPPLIASDNCGVASISSNAPAFFPVGVTPVTWTVVDVNSNTNNCTQLVVITDNQLPQFTCPNAITNNADLGQCGAAFALPPLMASDNCGVSSISSNAPTFFSVGVTPVTWTVVDVNGNTNTCTQLVAVVDNQPPQIVCPANITTNVTMDCSQVVSWAVPPTSDNCSVTNVVSIPPSGSVFPVGTTTVNSTVWDASGNINTCNFTVTVTALADLALTMSATPDPVTLGSNVIYSMTISNAGPCNATDVVVTNFLSSGQVALLTTNQLNLGMGCPYPGPTAWWPAEGSATDVIGGNNGTLAGGVGYIAGTVSQSFNFDGTSGSVTVPDAPGLRPQSLTIEGWIKIHDVTGVHVVIGKRLGVGTTDSYSLWIGSGVLFASMADNLGSGPFLTYPEFPTSSIFAASDIVNLQSFAYKLQPANPADQVSWFIKTNLSPATTILLAAYGGGPDNALLLALLHDLNIIIGDGSIYDVARFSGVTLSSETQYILGRNPTGPDLVRLNRFLIRDAYPAEFAATIFPQLNDWFHVAYSFDASSQVQALYVNGVLVNLGTVNKLIAYDSHPVLIGADDDNGSPGYFYQGEVDELALYDRALTGAEIKGIYQAGSGGKCAVSGSISVGTIPSGTTAQVSLVAMATNCPMLVANATVVSGTVDSNLSNNSAAATVSVQELPSSDWVLGIDRVSVNNNLLRITWPLACGGLSLETTTNLSTPIIWSPANLPVQLINSRQTTIVPAEDTMRYFRATTP